MLVNIKIKDSTCLESIPVHHQESSTVHTAIHTGYADCLLASSQQTCMTYTIAVCTVLDS